ncbi:MAG: Fur family transcriptional regulator [Anaerolineales bacterium]|nr:Fur family transcriptional regulator [Anaerolineales bacterium]
MSDQVEILSLAVTDSGYRLTSARRAIIKTLVGTGGHISADELVVIVRESSPQIGRMTVYRTLDLLAELGVVRPIYQGTGAASYILMSGGSHHHMICNRCHDVIEFDHCTAREITKQLSELYRFKVSSHLLEFHGVCQSCLAG